MVPKSHEILTFCPHKEYEQWFYGAMMAVRSVGQCLGFSPSVQEAWVQLPGLTTSGLPWLLKICVGGGT